MTSLATLEDSTLIDRTLAGEPECFSVLVDRHGAAVRKRVKSMARNTSDQDDIVQETFLKAWRGLSSFRSDASFRTWITSVATNEALQQHRREQHNCLHFPYSDPENCASRHESPHESLTRSEACHTVRTAVAHLPEKYRQALTLRDLDELTIQETARHLQCSIPLVKTRLFRARQMLLRTILRRSARTSNLPPIQSSTVFTHSGDSAISQ